MFFFEFQLASKIETKGNDEALLHWTEEVQVRNAHMHMLSTPVVNAI